MIRYNHAEKENLAKSSNTVKPTANTYRPNKSVCYSQFSTIWRYPTKITEQGGVGYSKCLILAGFTGHNKSHCKISIWNKLTLHIA